MINIFKKKIKRCHYCDDIFENKEIIDIPIFTQNIEDKVICEFPLGWFSSCDKCREYQKDLTEKEFKKNVAKEIKNVIKEKKKIKNYISLRNKFLNNKK